MRACEEKKARRSPKSNLESSRAKNKKNERITSTLARLKSTQQEKVSVRLDQSKLSQLSVPQRSRKTILAIPELEHPQTHRTPK